MVQHTPALETEQVATRLADNLAHVLVPLLGELDRRLVRTCGDTLVAILRGQIEWAWRYGKSERALESPRLGFAEKLLLRGTLLYDFLLTLLAPMLEPLRAWLLKAWCQRTGQRSQQTLAPLSRLRSALSALWLAYRPPPPLDLLQTPG